MRNTSHMLLFFLYILIYDQKNLFRSTWHHTETCTCDILIRKTAYANIWGVEGQKVVMIRVFMLIFVKYDGWDMKKMIVDVSEMRMWLSQRLLHHLPPLNPLQKLNYTSRTSVSHLKPLYTHLKASLMTGRCTLTKPQCCVDWKGVGLW